MNLKKGESDELAAFDSEIQGKSLDEMKVKALVRIAKCLTILTHKIGRKIL